MQELGIILARATAEELGSAGPALLNLYLVLYLVPNTIFLPILAATFLFSKTSKRNPALINVLMTWIVAGFFSLLLFYGGYHVGPEPPQSLCIAQASLLYGITPMWSVALFVLVVYMFMLLNGVKNNRARMILMLIAPYLTLGIFFWAALVMSLRNPTKVSRSRKFFYCSVKASALSEAMTIFTLIMVAGILLVQGLLARTVYISWKGLRKVGKSGLGLDIQLLIRLCFFGLYIFFGMIVAFVNLFDAQSILPDMYTATLGLVVFLVFGTQPDVLNVWCFWREKKDVIEISRGDQTAIDLLKSAAPTKNNFFHDAEKYPVPPMPEAAGAKLLQIPVPAHSALGGFSPIQLVRSFTLSNTAGFGRKKQKTKTGSSIDNGSQQWDGPRTPLILQPAPTRAARQAERDNNLASVV